VLPRPESGQSAPALDAERAAAWAALASKPWNHNIHYHSLILGALPADCRSVLDVGCGEGILALKLSTCVRRVTAIDIDAPTIALARRDASAENIDYVVGDFLTYPFESRFDAVVSVAALHHMETTAALTRMRRMLKPGGTLAIVGLARPRYPGDLVFDIPGLIATRWHQRSKGYWESAAPKSYAIRETYADAKAISRRLLPGAHYRRHILWRYTLVWRKPVGDD
jgi:SAM-dependent methyltransferase